MSEMIVYKCGDNVSVNRHAIVYDIWILVWCAEDKRSSRDRLYVCNCHILVVCLAPIGEVLQRRSP